MQRIWVATFNFWVKDKVQAHIIKILLLLLCLLNFWSFCYQTLFGGTVLEAGLSCENIDLLCSRSRSQQRSKPHWMLIWMISSELFNLFWPNLVWWCIIMSQNVMWKDCFALTRVKVTVRAYIIKNIIFAICSELLILSQESLTWWYSIIRWKYCFAVFSVSRMVQNFIECLCKRCSVPLICLQQD